MKCANTVLSCRPAWGSSVKYRQRKIYICAGCHPAVRPAQLPLLIRSRRKIKCYMENKSFHSVYRGDIFYADLEPVIGSEQGGVRPVRVIQNNKGNVHSPTVIVAVITSRMEHYRLPTHVNLDGGKCGLQHDSTIKLEQLRTLDKRRLLGYAGRVGKAKMKEVDKALEISVGTSKKPLPP